MVDNSFLALSLPFCIQNWIGELQKFSKIVDGKTIRSNIILKQYQQVQECNICNTIVFFHLLTRSYTYSLIHIIRQ